MAPEQIQGKPRPASDQYALGIVVYEWLSGTRPFNGTSIELMTQHVMAPPPPLHIYVPTLSPDVERVVLTALAKDPRERFANVQAFANALALASSPVPAQSASIDLETSTVTQTYQPTMKTMPARTEKTPEISPGQSFQQVSVPVTERKADAAHRGISRRTAALGLGLAGLMIASGGLAWFASSLNHNPVIEPSATLPSRLLYTYRGHSGSVHAVAWSRDGKFIASGGDDKTVQVWNAATGSTSITYKGHTNAVLSVIWSRDGKLIASGGADKTVQVWQASE